MSTTPDFTWWMAFLAVIIALLLLDLFVFHRKSHEVRPLEALGWSIFWISLALLFNVFVFIELGPDAATKFFTAYIVEESLSVDNLFVFAVIMSYFRVPASLQHHVLFWGIIGAIVTRALFIGVGTWLIGTFSWSTYLFGAILLYTGGRMAFGGEASVDIEANPLMRFMRRRLPMTLTYSGRRFVVRDAVGGVMVTPLLVVLLMVESTDIVFALDSIPAVFAVSSDPFIVFTSNIFAILGLRSLYFLLAAVIERFHLLRYGLALVLVFTGGKMVAAGLEWHVETGLSLAVIATALAGSVLLSLLFPQPSSDSAVTLIEGVAEPETAE
jgi:tellurite resistance protein TerC